MSFTENPKPLTNDQLDDVIQTVQAIGRMARSIELFAQDQKDGLLGDDVLIDDDDATKLALANSYLSETNGSGAH